MSEFKTEVVRIHVKPHPNADRLEIAEIGSYQSIVGKGQFQTGDLVAYIQEGSLVPEEVLEELNLKGKLSGANKDRVKAVRLRGVLSQGICYPAKPEWEEGDDVSEILGIAKYEPPIPTEMSGLLYNGGGKRTIKYDIENLKRYPDAIRDNEPVLITEKIHGTNCCIGVLDKALAHPEHGCLAVSSKGLGARGQVFIPDAPENANNLYLRAARQYDVENKVRSYIDAVKEGIEKDGFFNLKAEDLSVSVFVLGEVFGKGVQDLHYGSDVGSDEIGFRVFDAYLRVETPDGHEEGYLGPNELLEFCEAAGLETVPVLYDGPFSMEVVKELTDGKESVSGEESHLREGVVVWAYAEIPDKRLERRKLKSVSEAYLTRKDGTEYN